MDAEAEEVLNELNSLTEGENATILSSNKIKNDGSDWSQTIGMPYFVLQRITIYILLTINYFFIYLSIYLSEINKKYLPHYCIALVQCKI